MKTKIFNVAAGRVGQFATCLILGMAMLPQSARSASSYAAAVLNDHPVAFWQLNETADPSSGTLQAVDATGHGHSGTYGATSQNAFNGILGPQPPTYPGFTTGEGALQCTANDTNSPVTLPSLNLNTNAVTIAMWLNPATAVGTFRGLLMNRDPGGDAAGFGFGGNSDATGMAELGYTWNTNSGATWGFHSGLFPVAGIWQFAALVVQSNSATIYLCYVDTTSGQTNLLSAVNAIAHDPQAFAAGLTLLGDDVVNGNAGDSGRVFPGAIAGAAVFNAALSPDQILGLFAAGVGVNGFAPRITGQPRSQYVLAGAKAQLSATGVLGTSPLTYQWQLNGTNVNLLPDSANFNGASSNVLTILSATTNDTGSYQLIVTNPIATTFSSNAMLTIQSPALIGQWLDGSAAGTNLLDVSGSPQATNHPAYFVGFGTYEFTNDVPVGKTGYSLAVTGMGLAISNSSSTDLGYLNTFDEPINNAMTVGVWAKGWPGGWNPFVSKWGENGLGWQLRQDGQNNLSPCWTIRGTGGAVTKGEGVYNNPEDLAATEDTFGNDGNWHLYVGTYDASTGVRNLYVDGVLGASEVSNAVYALAPTAHLCLGARDTNGVTDIGTFFTGQLYDVRVYNYAIDSAAVLNWYGVIPPGISLQPRSAFVFAGRPAQFTVNASGTPPLTYQWQLNGANIDSLANSTNYTGIHSNVLSILSATTNEVGSYHVIITSTLGYGTATSSNAALVIMQPGLVGRWFSGTNTDFTDVSGYSGPGTHDGYAVGGASYSFTADTPPGFTGQSFYLSGTDTGIAISNSATGDPAYTNTFDDIIHDTMTVTFWAKGYPGSWSWNPVISKQGDSGPGWQFREGGGPGVIPCWTVRGGGWAGCTLLQGAGPSWAQTGDLEDLHAGTGVGNSVTYYNVDNNWHFYAGTFNTDTRTRNIYIDGAVWAATTNEPPYSMSPGAHVVIGGRDVNGTIGNFSSFHIFDARIYNIELTASQIVGMMPDPVIMVQPPSSLNAYVHGDIALRATTATHSSPVTNQWQFNGTNLVDGGYGGTVISGANSTTLSLLWVQTNWQGVYRLIVSDPGGTVISTNVSLTVLAAASTVPATNLVGAWLMGAANLADSSGFMPAGTHDGYGVSGTGTNGSNYLFTNDTPPGHSGQSLYLNPSGSVDTCIAITNSSILDGNYTNTFDDVISNMTVMFWAKGIPSGGWNPFVSKYGESGQGWQLRRDGGFNPCWTLRGTGGAEDMSGAYPFINDGQWHHYAGTFDGTTFVRNLYMDGVLSATETGTGPYAMSPTSHFALGGRDAGGNTFGNYFQGKLYGIRVYSAALTEAQINSFLVSPTPPVPVFGRPVLMGNQLVLSWPYGTLLTATNVTGPWTPSGAKSPYTNNVTAAREMFFRLSNP